MQPTGQRILITGAAGFIGSHLADRLAVDNQLILVDDFSVGSRSNLDRVLQRENVELIEADIRDRERMYDLVRQVDIVCHLAISCLRTSLRQPFTSHQINAGGTLNLLVAADRAQISRFLYVSTSEVYGTAQQAPMTEDHPLQPTTVYGASKLAGEQYALAFYRTFGLPVSVVRPFNAYGPRSPFEGSRAEVIPRFILQLQQRRAPVIFGTGEQTRDFTYVTDTAEGLARAAGCDALVGQVVNLAYGHEIPIREVARLLSRLSPGPDLDPEYVEARPGDVERHFASTERASRLLDFEPKVGLREGLERTLDWFQHRDFSNQLRRTASQPNW